MTEKEDRLYIDRIERRVGRAINRYSLLGAGDRVAVALSGGVDSLVLLETLALRRRRLPVSYELFAIHVCIKNIGYEADAGFMEEFCSSLGVPFTLAESEADLEFDKSKSRCFVCSWHRRKALFDFAGEMNCGKLAFGHHMDDALETLMMNMTYNGAMRSLPPSLPVFSGTLELIRPLILLEKSEIEKYAAIRNFPAEPARCPYADDTKRREARETIVRISGGESSLKRNMFNAMSNIRREYLPPQD